MKEMIVVTQWEEDKAVVCKMIGAKILSVGKAYDAVSNRTVECAQVELPEGWTTAIVEQHVANRKALLSRK